MGGFFKICGEQATPQQFAFSLSSLLLTLAVTDEITEEMVHEEHELAHEADEEEEKLWQEVRDFFVVVVGARS